MVDMAIIARANTTFRVTPMLAANIFLVLKEPLSAYHFLNFRERKLMEISLEILSDRIASPKIMTSLKPSKLSAIATINNAPNIK